MSDLREKIELIRNKHRAITWNINSDYCCECNARYPCMTWVDLTEVLEASDLVARLRVNGTSLYDQAADRIEALEAELETMTEHALCGEAVISNGRATIAQLEADLAANATINAVRALHTSTRGLPKNDDLAKFWCGECGQPYPCNTLDALESATPKPKLKAETT